MSTTVTLPLPPSVNALWRFNRGRVHRSRRYLVWTEGCRLGDKSAATPQDPRPGRLDIRRRQTGDRRRRGLDNIATKAILDLLTAHQVISDDHFVVKVTAGWDATIPPGTVRITVDHGDG